MQFGALLGGSVVLARRVFLVPLADQDALVDQPGQPGGQDLAGDAQVVGQIGEAARVLAPGGSLVYDTVSRTAISRLVYLGAFQTVPMTRIMPPGRYASGRLRTPDEVTAALARSGLRNRDIREFKPRNALSLVRAILARRSGRITDEEIPPLVDFVLSQAARPQVTYLGHAVKR
ncbi:hypothetical protein [Kitasatospora sp. NPDC058190]|uniref:hypothetical protein n=1 Tax=Kitasatospora sp. NPDC058190 TaxID=3346371 RepID=UPI0036DA96E2